MVNDLTQLRDIHLPPPIGYWPIAPGWFLLIAIITTAILTIGFFLRNHYKNGYAKREALKMLSTYEQHYLQDKNNQACCAAISNVLRRVALAYYPRTDVAGLQGDAWIAFLNRNVKGISFTPVRTLLLEQPYRTTEQTQNLQPLFDTAHSWIQQQGKPCSN